MIAFHIQVIILYFCLIGNGTHGQRLPRPARVRAASRTPTSVELTWEQPPAASGITYNRFMLSVRPPTAIVEEPEDAGVTRRAIRNLRPGFRYIVSIVGITLDGRRSPPNNYQLWSEPLPPTNLTLETLYQIQVVVSFFGVENTYSSETVGVLAEWSPSPSMTGLSGYDVQMSPRHGTETFPRPLSGQESELTSRIFIGLVPGEEYTLTVRAQTGPPYRLVYSSPVSQTIRIPPAIPYSAEVSDVGRTHASIQTIGPLKGIHDSLFLELQPNHGQVNFPRPDPIRETHDLYQITGLSPGTTYQLRVYSVSQGVRSDEFFSTEFTTSPLPPSDVRIIGLTSNSVTLRWTQSIQSQEEFVQYLIEYINEMIPEDLVTERVTVETSNSTVYATIYRLIPGVIYSFNVLSELSGVQSEARSTTITQSTIPLLPRLEFFGGSAEGVSFRLLSSMVGECSRVSVTYSPPLPGESRVEPKIYEANMTIILPGIPTDERYSIHIVCVSGTNVEGPPLIVSSRAVVDSNSSNLHDEANLPRIPLACIRFRQSFLNSTGLPESRPIRPPGTRPRDFVSPDGCCGVKPYRNMMRMCCGGVLYTRSTTSLCCGTKIYSLSNEVCCGNSNVAPAEEGCAE